MKRSYPLTAQGWICALALLGMAPGGVESALQGVSHWEFSGWYGGGCYPDVVFDPRVPGRVYLTSDVAGIWRSNDGGDHWWSINRGLGNLNVASIAIAPSDSMVVYAATKGGLFISRDAGASWSPVNNPNGNITFARPESHHSVAVDFQDPNHVCIGTAKGAVFCSDDGGKTWGTLGAQREPLTSTTSVTTVALTRDGKYLVVSSAAGIARFSFSAMAWEPLEGGPRPVTDLALVDDAGSEILAAGQKWLYMSLDGGRSWSRSSPVPQGDVYRVVPYTADGVRVISVLWKDRYDGGMLVSRDQGHSWLQVERALLPDLAGNPTRAWAAVKRRSTSLAVDPVNPDVIIRTDWWGVWRSTDGGVTWKEKIGGAPNTVGSDIHVSDGRIYVATMDNGLLGSSDHGMSYVPLFPVKGYQKSLNGHVWRVATVRTDDHQRILATSSPWGEEVNQVLISDDQGQHFRLARAGLPARRPTVNTMWGEGYPRALAVDPQHSSRIYLGIDGDDGGGLFISTDGGETWQRSPGQPGSLRIYNALAVDPTDSKRIAWGACGKGGGVYLSRDAGLSWDHVLRELSWVFDLAIAKDGTLYAAGDQDGPVLYVSRDHGTHWKLLERFQGHGACEAITLDPDHPGRMAVSSVQWSNQAGGRIYLSDDSGMTWKDITGDLPEGTGAAAMAFSKDGMLYMSRYAGSVYKTSAGRPITP